MRKNFVCLITVLAFCFSFHVIAAATSVQADKLILVENNGQVKSNMPYAPESVLFYAITEHMHIFIQSDRISYQMIRKAAGEKASTYRADMVLIGAQKPTDFGGTVPNAYYETHYDRENQDIIVCKSYNKILIQNVYPKIDWVIYSEDFGLKYDFIVHPGGDPSVIQFKYENATSSSLNESGGIDIQTPFGTVSEAKPFSYQGSSVISSSFLNQLGIFSFKLGAYDTTKDLTIDPDVVWTSYFGGSGYDEARASVTDENGNIYITGMTSATSGIATPGLQTNYGGGNYDAFITKFSSNGQRIWSTYFGGSGSDFGNSIALDMFGGIYIGGATSSSSGIATTQQTVYGGGLYDGYYAKFNVNGILLWASYIGGPQEDLVQSIDVNPAGRIAILATVKSNAISTTGGYQTTYGGGTSDMYLRYAMTNGTPLWSTHIGGLGEDVGSSICFHADTLILVGGYTASTNAIASSGAQNTYGGGLFDGYIGLFDDSGLRLWSTYAGSTGDDQIHAVTSNNFDHIYVSGSTTSTTGFASTGASQNTNQGGEYDAFISRYSFTNQRLWCTFFGGEGLDRGFGIATDELGNVYLGGITSSENNINDDAFQESLGGGTDLFFAFFDSTGTKSWSSYLGGVEDEVMRSMSADENSRVVFTGASASPAAAINGWSTQYSGGTDGFIGKIQDCNNPYVTVNALGEISFCEGEEVAMTVGGADHFEWSTGDTTTVITVDTTMVVYVIGRLANSNCKALSNVFFVEMLDAPSVTAYTEGPTEFCGNGGVWLYADSELEDAVFIWNTSETGDSLFVSEDDDYFVQVIADNGCVGESEPIDVDVIEVPDVVAAIVTDTTCISTPNVDIIGLPFGGWYEGPGIVGNTFIPEVAGGGYHLITYNYTDPNTGCTGTSEVLDIEVLYEETILFVDAVELCVFDAPIGMYGYPEGGYYLGPGVSGNMFYPEIAGPGYHEVVYVQMDINGCNNEGVQTIFVDACTGVEEVSANQIRVYPNPAHDILHFDTANTFVEQIRINDITGKTVQQVSYTPGLDQIDISTLPAGVYMIVFKTGDTLQTKQILKV